MFIGKLGEIMMSVVLKVTRSM